MSRGFVGRSLKSPYFLLNPLNWFPSGTIPRKTAEYDKITRYGQETNFTNSQHPSVSEGCLGVNLSSNATITASFKAHSICLTCIIAHDNAKLHTIQKKYVLLREFARQNKEWADKADLIEYLYTDEAEHQEEIQRLWENRHKRLERRETKSIGHP